MGYGNSTVADDRALGHTRPYLGRGLFACGVGLIVTAIVLATSSVIAESLGIGTTGAHELAGATAGIGLASVLVGTLAVVPTNRRAWHLAVLGAFVALCGVGAFLWAYPGRWYGDALDLALPVVAVYFFGVITTVSYLFAGVRNVAARTNRVEAPSAIASASSGATDTDIDADADTERIATADRGADRTRRRSIGDGDADGKANGGTIEYGEGLTIESANGTPSGQSDPEPTPTVDRIEPSEFPSETASPSANWHSNSASDTAAEPEFSIEALDRTERSRVSNGGSSRSTRRDRSERPVRTAFASNGAGAAETTAGETTETAEPGANFESVQRPTADGPAATTPTADDPREPVTDDGSLDTLRFDPSVDKYCGNCTHFQYVRTERGLEPYCGYHDEVMDDMDSCLEWSSNS